MGIHLTPKRQENLATPYGMAKRATSRFRWILILLILSTPLTYLLYKIFIDLVLISFPGFIVFDALSIRAPQEGYVESISVKLGQKVKTGMPLLKLKSTQLNEKLNALEIEKQKLTKLITEISYGTPVLNNSLIAAAKENIVNTETVYLQFKKYADSGHILLLQLEEARQNYYLAKQNLAKLQIDIEEKKLTNQINFEINYHRKLREIDDQINQIKETEKHFNINAVNAGTVMQLTTYPNEFVSAGQQLMTLITKDNLRVIAYIDPKYLDKIYYGKKVLVNFPNRESVEGVIINEPSYAEQTPLAEMNPLSPRQNKLVAIIKTKKVIPLQYQIYGIPVKVELN